MSQSPEQSYSAEHIPTATPLQKLLGKAVEYLAHRYSVTLEQTENSYPAIEAVEAGRPLIVFFIPHTATKDPIFLAHMIQEYLLVGQPKVPAGYITSAKFTGEVEGVGSVGPFGLGSHTGRGWGHERGLRFFPVVQSYLYENLSPAKKEAADALLAGSFRQACKFLRSAKKTGNGRVLMISAEGTRNPLPGLIRANAGLGRIMKLTQALALPVYMRGAQNMSLTAKKTQLTFGFCPPIDYQTANKEMEKYQWNHQSSSLQQMKQTIVKDNLTMFGLDKNPEFTINDYLHWYAVQHANLEQFGTMDPAGIYSQEHIIPK